jgi:hypothetical protein
VLILALGGGSAFVVSNVQQKCVARGALPDPRCTPGQALPGITAAQICERGYASKIRDVSQATKDKVYAAYGVTSHKSGEYEVDHLISLELGGSNDISNLWPEAALPKLGFHEKDRVENYLHVAVCSDAMALGDAQRKIAGNWINVYNSMPK